MKVIAPYTSRLSMSFRKTSYQPFPLYGDKVIPFVGHILAQVHATPKIMHTTVIQSIRCNVHRFGTEKVPLFVRSPKSIEATIGRNSPPELIFTPYFFYLFIEITFIQHHLALTINFKLFFSFFNGLFVRNAAFPY